MSAPFEPLGVASSVSVERQLDRDENFTYRLILSHVRNLVQHERRQPNRYNRHNRVKTINTSNGIKSSTSEIWLYSDESDDEVDDHLTREQQDSEDDNEHENSQIRHVKRRKLHHQSRILYSEKVKDYQVTYVPPPLKFNNNMSKTQTSNYKTLALGHEIVPRRPVMIDQQFVKYAERTPCFTKREESLASENEHSQLIVSSTYQTYLINNLLHINMLRQNWKLSYKIYCLITKIRGHELRNDWTIALEILKNLNQNEFLQVLREQTDDNINDSQLQLLSRSVNIPLASMYHHNHPVSFEYITKSINDPRMKKYRRKITNLLKLLHNTYNRNIPKLIGDIRYPNQILPYKSSKPRKSSNDEELEEEELQSPETLLRRRTPLSLPTYTTTSANMMALYTYTLLWELIISGQFKEFDKLAESLRFNQLANKDPMYSYLVALSKHVQCIYLYSKLKNDFAEDYEVQIIYDDMNNLLGDCKNHYTALKQFKRFQIDLNSVFNNLDELKKMVDFEFKNNGKKERSENRRKMNDNVISSSSSSEEENDDQDNFGAVSDGSESSDDEVVAQDEEVIIQQNGEYDGDSGSSSSSSSNDESEDEKDSSSSNHSDSDTGGSDSSTDAGSPNLQDSQFFPDRQIEEDYAEDNEEDPYAYLEEEAVNNDDIMEDEEDEAFNKNFEEDSE